MAQHVVLKATGLYTFPNPLSEAPVGALVETDNVVIDKDGIINPRRGFKLYGDDLGTKDDRAKQLMTYKGRILRHWASTIDWDNGSGTFTPFSGSFSEADSSTRIKYLEANGNFYFTTSSGIKKISLSDSSKFSTVSITNAGGVKALNAYAELNLSGSGFLTQESVVGYRVLWGNKDANNNLILGAPSDRFTVSCGLLDLLIPDIHDLARALDLAAVKSTLDTFPKINTPKVITGASQANPTVITCIGHGFDDGASVAISVSDSVPAIYGTYTITKIGPDSFSIPVDLSTGTAGTTGEATNFYTKKYALVTNETATNVGTALVNLATDLNSDIDVIDFPTAALGPFSIPPTTTELLTLQTRFNDIIDKLNSYIGTKIDAGVPSFIYATISCDTNLTIYIPDNITTSYIYQIYRTALVTSEGVSSLDTQDPGDECRLVYESNPTQTEINNRVLVVNDILPTTFRDGGANLYTNENSGEGIVQANTPPPFAKDMAYFKGSTFYANTKTRHQLELNLLSVDDLIGNYLVIGKGTNGTKYKFVASNPGSKEIQVFTGGTPAQNIDDTAREIVRIINLQSSENVNAYYISLPTEIPGSFLLEAKELDDVPFYVVGSAAISAKFNPEIGKGHVNISVDAGSISTTAMDGKVTIKTASIHGLAVNNTIVLLGTNSTPVIDGTAVVTDIVDSTHFKIETTVTVAGNAGEIVGAEDAVISDNEICPNRVFYSKYQQPEAVPIVNYFDVGPKDKAILRILPLRDSLFILKEDAIYRLSGDSTINFQVFLFDSSTQLRAPDSAVVLNNQIYMFSTQGIATISDTGVSIISRPIENLLLPILRYTDVRAASFALSYESDRAYLLWTLKNATDTTATVCYRYNTFTNTWVSWDINKTCGVINPSNDKIYLGAGDTNYIEIERKDFERTDYADREESLQIFTNSISGSNLALGNLLNTEMGDVLVQEQRLTIRQLNQLLQKLDRDGGVNDNDYLSTLQAFPGYHLREVLALLATKLDNDSGITFSGFAAGIAGFADTFQGEQDAFNYIVNKLNDDNTVLYTNYLLSSGITPFETALANVNNQTKVVIMEPAVDFIAGPVTQYKHIESHVIWAPQHFGDVSVLKHVRESTIILESEAFDFATASFSSDVRPGFVDIPFQGEGDGNFGIGAWGVTTWGGTGTQRPFRTYIPADKQRCRFLNAKFTHGTAFDKYGLYGISFTFELLSTRAYR